MTRTPCVAHSYAAFRRKGGLPFFIRALTFALLAVPPASFAQTAASLAKTVDARYNHLQSAGPMTRPPASSSCSTARTPSSIRPATRRPRASPPSSLTTCAHRCASCSATPSLRKSWTTSRSPSSPTGRQPTTSPAYPKACPSACAHSRSPWTRPALYTPCGSKKPTAPSQPSPLPTFTKMCRRTTATSPSRRPPVSASSPARRRFRHKEWVERSG